MSFGGHFDYAEVYSVPTTPLSHRYRSYYQPKIPTLKPSESFFMHFEDAKREELPNCVRVYRPKFSQRMAKLRQQRVKERRRIILKDRVDCLAQRLESVRQANADYHEKRNQNWQRIREHIASDMQRHQQRRERKLIERVELLRIHNGQVKSRCELLKYGNYLRRIARQHEERHKRRSIF